MESLALAMPVVTRDDTWRQQHPRKRGKSCFAAIAYRPQMRFPMAAAAEPQQPRSAVEGLTLDMYEIILRFCSFRDVMRLARVSRELRRVVFAKTTILDLRGVATRVNDHRMRWLTSRFQAIECIDLSECNGITDASCESLRSWRQLRSICFGNCLSISDGGVALLAHDLSAALAYRFAAAT